MAEFFKLQKGSNLSVPDEEWLSNSFIAISNRLTLQFHFAAEDAFAAFTRVLFVFLWREGVFDGERKHWLRNVVEVEYRQALEYARRSEYGNLFFADLQMAYSEPWADDVWRQLNEQYAFRSTDRFAVAIAYEMALKSVLRRWRAYSRVSSELAEAMVRMVGPMDGECICDPACGLGVVLKCLQNLPTDKPLGILAVEAYPPLVVITRMRMLLDGRPDIKVRSECGAEFFSGNGLVHDSVDVIVTAPPIGPWARAAEVGLGNCCFFGDEGENLNMEESYLLGALSLLRAGGRMAIALPESFLVTFDKQHVRQMVLRRADVTAIVEIPREITGRWSVPMCVLVLRKHSGMSCGGPSMLVRLTGGPVQDRAARQSDLLDIAQKICVHAKEGRSVGRYFSIFAEHLSHAVVWSPSALVADFVFTQKYGPCRRIGDFLKLVWQPRRRGSLRSMDFLRNDVDGLSLSRGVLPADRHSDYEPTVMVASRGDLLVSRVGARFVANVVPEEYAGLPLDEECRTYSRKGPEIDLDAPAIVSLFFRSRVYQRYIRSRVNVFWWQDCLPSFLIPDTHPALLRHALDLLSRLEKDAKQLQLDMFDLSNRVSRIYRRELQESRESQIAGRSLSWVPMLFMLDRHGRPDDNEWNPILRNLFIDESRFDVGYLEGLLMCDFMPHQVSNVVRRRVPYGFIPALLRNVILPTPELSVQRQLAGQCGSYVERYKVLLSRYAEMQRHDEVAELIDREVFHEDR